MHINKPDITALKQILEKTLTSSLHLASDVQLLLLVHTYMYTKRHSQKPKVRSLNNLTDGFEHSTQ